MSFMVYRLSEVEFDGLFVALMCGFRDPLDDCGRWTFRIVSVCTFVWHICQTSMVSYPKPICCSPGSAAPYLQSCRLR